MLFESDSESEVRILELELTLLQLSLSLFQVFDKNNFFDWVQFLQI